MLYLFSFCSRTDDRAEAGSFYDELCANAAYKLKTYNNILALEDEYKNLKDNMNFQTIRDSDSVDTINNLMDAIHNERKNHKNRERLTIVVERRMNNALFTSAPHITTIVSGGANPLSLAINTASILGSTFTSYQQLKNQISEEYDEKMFEFQNLTEDILNNIYTDLNRYTFNLMKRYEIPDEWRLNETELSDIFKYLKDSDTERAYSNLKAMSEGRYVQHFPMFWYHLAKAAYDANDKNAALRYYNRFEKENIEIFRYDRTAVDAYKGKITLLCETETAQNKKEIISKLQFIEKNKTSWNDYYFCALVYAKLGDKANAKRLLERNINELSSEVDNQFANGTHLYDLLKTAEADKPTRIFESAKNLIMKKSENTTPVETVGSIEYDGLELCRALLTEIGEKSTSSKSIEAQYKNDTQSANEVLWLFGGNSYASIVKNSKEDAKKVLLSTKVLSEKTYQVDVKIPLQWVLSANTDILAVFWQGDKPITFLMKIDEKETKRLKKAGTVTPKNTVICYTTGKIDLNWKKENIILGGIFLYHSAYPIEFEYSNTSHNEIDMNKPVKDIAPYSIYFNEKSYGL